MSAARFGWEATVSDAITELAAGLTNVGLYGIDHPRARHAVGRLVAQLGELLAENEQLSCVLLGEELFVQGKPFTQTCRQAPTLIRRLRRRDVELVTFKPGVGEDEVRGFLEAMAASDQPVASRPHIEVGKVNLSDVELGGPDDSSGGQGTRNVPTVRDRVTLVSEVFATLATGGVLVAADLHRVCQAVLGGIKANPDPMEHMAPWEGDERWLAVHSYNACVLAEGLARLAGLGDPWVLDLGFAALAHDLGRAALPVDLIARELATTGGEQELVLDHPKTAMELLLAAEDVPPLAVIVAYEHHLNYNGTGYPRLPRPRRPHPATRMITLVDTYVTLHTALGGRGLLTREGINARLAERAGTVLDPGWVEAILDVTERGWEDVQASATPPLDQIPG